MYPKILWSPIAKASPTPEEHFRSERERERDFICMFVRHNSTWCNEQELKKMGQDVYHEELSINLEPENVFPHMGGENIWWKSLIWEGREYLFMGKGSLWYGMGKFLIWDGEILFRHLIEKSFWHQRGNNFFLFLLRRIYYLNVLEYMGGKMAPVTWLGYMGVEMVPITWLWYMGREDCTWNLDVVHRKRRW